MAANADGPLSDDDMQTGPSGNPGGQTDADATDNVDADADSVDADADTVDADADSVDADADATDQS